MKNMKWLNQMPVKHNDVNKNDLKEMFPRNNEDQQLSDKSFNWFLL